MAHLGVATRVAHESWQHYAMSRSASARTDPCRSAPSPAGGRRRLGRAATLLPPALVLALALAGFLLVVPEHVAVPSRLSAYVPKAATYLHLKRTLDASQPPANGLPTLAGAAVAHPSRTGSWQVSWTGSGAYNGDEVYVVLDELPDAATAAALAAQMDAGLAAAVAGPTPGYKPAGSVRLPAALSRLAGSVDGLTSVRPKSATQAYGSDTAIVVRVGPTVVNVVAQQNAPTRAGAVALAEREIRSLHTVRGVVDLQATAWPWLAALLWWLVALAVAAASVVLPRAVLAVGARRRARAEALARSQFQMRGAKVLKRRAPARPSRGGKRPVRR